MAVKIVLNETLEKAGITRNALAREARVRPNLIYDMCDGKTRRIELETLNTLISTLTAMTGRPHFLADILADGGE
ncbi:hypothetical protein C162_26055 [Paenibacillus sp. FSL R7-269]|uniref:helix-turn-helix domain-containing protein n=1 Tax=Paenibacillus sp. FSL R7-269 TaxID=1226755 RepID=UPI0003E29BDF|nr:helix-turn-helix domain-containing protein [Paenibacillus sp. FSL R7-269]ETT41602.1 hypothetical protein C162_26055 [Paenibacillus sp. FSL R7-269]